MRYKEVKKILLFTLLFFAPFWGYGQLDTKHYILPMFGREYLGDHYLILSTNETAHFDVIIKDSAGNLIGTETISNTNSNFFL